MCLRHQLKLWRLQLNLFRRESTFPSGEPSTSGSTWNWCQSYWNIPKSADLFNPDFSSHLKRFLIPNPQTFPQAWIEQTNSTIKVSSTTTNIAPNTFKMQFTTVVSFLLVVVVLLLANPKIISLAVAPTTPSPATANSSLTDNCYMFNAGNVKLICPSTTVWPTSMVLCSANRSKFVPT